MNQTTTAARAADAAPTPRHTTFGPASEQPYRRRTSDWLRFSFVFVLFVGTCFHYNDLTTPERSPAGSPPAT